jgi:hypothetical protein
MPLTFVLVRILSLFLNFEIGVPLSHSLPVTAGYAIAVPAAPWAQSLSCL